MNIIIAGCGKVGCALAEQLNNEGHEVSVIDTNTQILQEATARLDIMGVEGNCTSYKVQKEAGIDEADLMIAVTNRDEINMLACLIAKKTGNCHTIARVRNPEYYQEISYIKEELGLSMSVNPELAAAAEIARLIQVPSALEVDTFAKGRVSLIKIQIPEKSVLNQLSVRDMADKVSQKVLICIVEREKEIIIPSGNFVLQSGDYISVTIAMSEINRFLNKIGIHAKPIRNVMIAGGGTISYYLAKLLLASKVNVKIVEHNVDRCATLSELLPEAMVIHGDVTERELLMEENIQEADAVAALTNSDEENVLLSLFANKVSKAKRMVKITRTSFMEVIDEMPVGHIISPKNITAEYIIRYVRSRQNSFDSSNVETLYRLVDGKVEVLEFIVGSNARIANKEINQIDTKDNTLICSIYRNGKVITPMGKDKIKPKDSVIVVTTQKGINGIDDIVK